jgi:hypothetical protein
MHPFISLFIVGAVQFIRYSEGVLKEGAQPCAPTLLKWTAALFHLSGATNTAEI